MNTTSEGSSILPCTALCTASSYNMKALFEALKENFPIFWHEEQIHIDLSDGPIAADVFIFSYGTMVTWNVSEKLIEQLRKKIKPFEEEASKRVDKENYFYQFGEKLTFNNDTITIDSAKTLTKLAFSHGLAQSVKLGVFEERISNIIDKTKHLPSHLARYGKIPLSRKAIRRQIGELFLERNAINFHLEVLDTPEFFWDNPQYEEVYLRMVTELDLDSRTVSLNHQLDLLHNLFEMLSGEMNDQHSNRLEWAIIWLIIIEVVLFLGHDILNMI